jgi:hypothetical protein
MTNKDLLENAFPQDKQIGGVTINFIKFNLMNLYLKMIYLFFKVML